MVNRIWAVLMLLALVCAAATGRGAQAGEALLSAGGEAVELTLTLLATMTLWSGLMEILWAAGDVARLGRLLRRTASPLFGGLRDEGCWEAMSMNLAANLLGLGNAATPAGVRAAQLLAGYGEQGMAALAMLLVLNNAGLQLLPTTVIALRQAAGSADPAGIWAASAAAGCASAAVGAAVLVGLRRIGRKAVRG